MTKLLPHKESMLSRVHPQQPLLCEAQGRSSKHFQDETVMLSTSWSGLCVVSVRDVIRANYVRGSPCVISQNVMQVGNDPIIVLEKQNYILQKPK